MKKFAFSHRLGGLRGNIQSSSMARWKARGANLIFLASSHGCGTIKRNLSKSAFSDEVGHFERKFYVDGDVARNPSIDR